MTEFCGLMSPALKSPQGNGPRLDLSTGCFVCVLVKHLFDSQINGVKERYF